MSKIRWYILLFILGAILGMLQSVRPPNIEKIKEDPPEETYPEIDPHEPDHVNYCTSSHWYDPKNCPCPYIHAKDPE